MINIDNVDQFVTEELRAGENLSLRKEGWIELITRLREAEKDAARYRWLKEQCSNEHWTSDGEETRKIEIVMWVNDGFDSCNYGEEVMLDEIDGIIDEAMQCK